jgi:hypothetical protein
VKNQQKIEKYSVVLPAHEYFQKKAAEENLQPPAGMTKGDMSQAQKRTRLRIRYGVSRITRNA